MQEAGSSCLVDFDEQVEVSVPEEGGFDFEKIDDDGVLVETEWPTAGRDEVTDLEQKRKTIR